MLCLDVLDVLFDRVGVIEPQVVEAAKFLGDVIADTDRLGGPDVKIAVRLGGEPRVHATAEPVTLNVLDHGLADKIDRALHVGDGRIPCLLCCVVHGVFSSVGELVPTQCSLGTSIVAYFSTLMQKNQPIVGIRLRLCYNGIRACAAPCCVSVKRKEFRMGKDTKTGRLIDLGAELEKLRHKATRMEAVARLGESGAKEAIEPLLRLCRRIKGEDQVAVAQALAQLGKPAVKMLAERGLASKSASVRRCAARALGVMGQEAQPAYKALCKGLEEKSTSVRLQIIDALGKIGDPRAAETLAGLLDDDDDDVRERAIDALGKLGDGALTAVREVFLGADAVRVRVAAGLALGQIGSSQAGDLLRQAFEDRSFPSELRVAILSALTDLLGKDVVPIAEAALSEDDNAIRQRAVRCLRHQDTPASTARLVSRLGCG